MDPRPALPGPRVVHVWLVELADDVEAVAACSRYLSEDERERAERFVYGHLQSAFTLARGVLRALLSGYLAVAPEQIRFAYGPRGKPRVECPATALEFNLAHSGAYAAYAFATDCALGIDIEDIEDLRRTRHHEGLVRRYFSPAECDEWLSLAPGERNAAFFRCWTRKEAYIKALGDGLAIPLDRFRVTLKPDAAPALLHDEADPAAADRWSIVSLIAPDGYAAALALPERGFHVRVMPALTAAEVPNLVREGELFPPESISSATIPEGE